jgi:hypothetical protein
MFARDRRHHPAITITTVLLHAATVAENEVRRCALSYRFRAGIAARTADVNVAMS